MARRLPPSVQRGFSRALNRVDLRGRGPLVSVVVPCHDPQADYFDEAIEALRFQAHRNLEILVLPHSTCDKVREIAGQHASVDWRVRVCDVSPELGLARNRGAQRARGKYLAFAGAADVIPPSGIQKLVKALETSGSDFAVGRLSKAGAPTGFGGSRQQTSHRRRLQGVAIAEFPVAITDAFEENRLFRTKFWKGAVLNFPESDRAVVRSPVVEAYLRASAFDILPEVTYRWMDRGYGLPFGHLHNAMDDLEHWLHAQRETVAVLNSAAPEVRDAWIQGVLDTDAIPFVDDVERASDGEWKALRDHVQALVDAAGPDVWPSLRAEPRVKAWLALHDRRAELEELVAARWYEAENRPTEVRDGVVYGVLPYYQDAALGIPDSCFVMAEAETPLHLSLRAVRWSDPETIELDLFTFIRYVAFDDETPEITAALVDPASGTRISLPVRHWVDLEVTRAAGHRYQNYDRGAFTVTVDAAEFARAAVESAVDPAAEQPGWWLDVSVSARGVSRNGTITHRDERGSAGAIRSSALAPRSVGSRRVDIAPDPDHGIQLRTEAVPATVLVSAEVTGRSVSGVLAASGEPPVRVRASRADVHVKADLTPSPDDSDGAGDRPGLLRFEMELPDAGFVNLDTESRHWTLRVVHRGGKDQPIGWPTSESASWLDVDPANGVAVHRTVQGNAELSEVAETAELDQVLLEEGRIRVRGQWLGRVPDAWTLELRGKRARQAATSVTSDGWGFEAEIPTRWDEWGTGVSCIPTGHYRLVVSKKVVGQVAGEETPTRLLMSQPMLDGLAEESLNDEFRMRVVRAGRDVGVNLSIPFTDDEKGPYAQKRLQERYAAGPHEIDPSVVYLQSYAGATATDSQLAIHQELRRSRPDLKLYWAVFDRSSVVPEGGIPIVMHSRAWYDVLASARYLVNNIDFDRWFSRRPGQEVLQTHHGYPAKSMGIGMWAAKQLTPRRIDDELERTSGDWDLMLTPAPEMDRYYREEYRYEGRIHSQGYPRDDILLSPEADEIRRATRSRLGIGEKQVVVLYAPTWRDHLATGHRSAPLVRHLDLESASQALGSNYVILLRGHRFHARGSRRSERTARLVDVTDYPEVNDLILASDAAVLDYSSMRFDFALTGRPMLFLVPDLHLYTGGVRGFLYDYRDTAPGPLLDTADEVVRHLKDLDTVAREHAAAYQRFNEKYNYLQDGHSAERVVAEFFGPPPGSV